MQARANWLRRIEALDRRVYRIEQVLCGALFVGMVGIMALYVLQRVFSRQEGRLSLGVLKIGAWLGQTWDPAVVHGPVSLAMNLGLGFLLALLAVRTGQATANWLWSKALLAAVALTLAGALAIWGVLAALPNGLVWGPAIALAGMLWTGFLGASLATYEKKHLALELADKLWPVRWQRAVKGLALQLTAALALLLCVLAWLSIREHFTTYLGDPEAGTLQPTEVPRFVLLAVLPVAWTVMALRFAAAGYCVWAGIAPAADEAPAAEPAVAEADLAQAPR